MATKKGKAKPQYAHIVVGPEDDNCPVCLAQREGGIEAVLKVMAGDTFVCVENGTGKVVQRG